MIIRRAFSSAKDVYNFASLKHTSQYILAKLPKEPKIGIICGSGLGVLASALSKPINIPYQNIPNFPRSTVPGHAGQLIFGELSSVPVVVMQGRFHYYEGYPLWKCSMPVRVMKLLGANYLIASNAAGGLNKCYKVGDIMLIKDHINMLGFGGNNPLRGPNEDRFGPRFPSMYGTYSKHLIEIAKKCAKEEGLQDRLHEGVYSCVGGPNFETIAELRMLGILGADAVGMSTAHEVIVATHCGMSVLAFSLITDICITDYESDDDVNHEEVLSVGIKSEKALKAFVTSIVGYLAIDIQKQNR